MCQKFFFYVCYNVFMKILFIIFALIINLFQPINYVNAESVCYAQVLESGCYLYKTANDNTNYNNVFFMLESSYFVQLLSDYNDEFYKAKYIDVIGYVKKSQVQCVQGIPNKPYLNDVQFRVYSNISREMYDKPYTKTNNPNLVIYLPLYCTDLIYYGKVYGESAIEERTNVWYYCKYTTTQQCGYVYSDACDQMGTIIKNTEKLPYISSPQWDATIQTSAELIQVDSKPFKITTVLICIPFAIFGILLIKFAITKSQNSTKKEVSTFDPFE